MITELSIHFRETVLIHAVLHSATVTRSKVKSYNLRATMARYLLTNRLHLVLLLHSVYTNPYSPTVVYGGGELAAIHVYS